MHLLKRNNVNSKINTLAALILSCFASMTANANTVLTEDFEGTFPAWKTNWFGANSNATNVYCSVTGTCNARGNNPDGLWIATTTQTSGQADVVFNQIFGASLTSFSLDVAGYVSTTLTAYDINGSEIFRQAVAQIRGAYTDPGVYARYTINSINGIAGFSFSGDAIGNTSIDNLVAVQGGNNVPEPAILALLGIGIVGLVSCRKKAT